MDVGFSASHKTMSSPDPKHTESFSPSPLRRVQDLLLSTCMERQTCRRCSCVVEYPTGTAARYANILLDKHLENCHSMIPLNAAPPDNIELTVAPRASTSISPSIASQYLLDDTDATSTRVGESTMTSPSLSSNETISLPDETNETNATEAPSTVGSPVSSKNSRLEPQKREMNETRRRIKLEEDLYTTDVRPKSVQCTECLREIRFVGYEVAATRVFDVDLTFSLDKRWNYYDYPWRKHRRTCSMIRITEVRPTP